MEHMIKMFGYYSLLYKFKKKNVVLTRHYHCLRLTLDIRNMKYQRLWMHPRKL